jgi:Ser-tRNA(Ala) deacylase AlaX
MIRIVDLSALDVQADGGTHVVAPRQIGSIDGQGGEQGQGQSPGTG